MINRIGYPCLGILGTFELPPGDLASIQEFDTATWVFADQLVTTGAGMLRPLHLHVDVRVMEPIMEVEDTLSNILAESLSARNQA